MLPIIAGILAKAGIAAATGAAGSAAAGAGASSAAGSGIGKQLAKKAVGKVVEGTTSKATGAAEGGAKPGGGGKLGAVMGAAMEGMAQSASKARELANQATEEAGGAPAPASPSVFKSPTPGGHGLQLDFGEPLKDSAAGHKLRAARAALAEHREKSDRKRPITYEMDEQERAAARRGE